MVQTDFRTALQGTQIIEITVTGRTSGRSFSTPFGSSWKAKSSLCSQ